MRGLGFKAEQSGSRTCALYCNSTRVLHVDFRDEEGTENGQQLSTVRQPHTQLLLSQQLPANPLPANVPWYCLLWFFFNWLKKKNLRWNSQNIKLTIFRWIKWYLINKFIILCNHYLWKSVGDLTSLGPNPGTHIMSVGLIMGLLPLKYFILPNREPMRQPLPTLPSPSPLEFPNLLSVSMESPILDISYTWNLTIRGLLCLVYLSPGIMFLRCTQHVSAVYLFDGWITSHGMYLCTAIYLSIHLLMGI